MLRYPHRYPQNSLVLTTTSGRDKSGGWADFQRRYVSDSEAQLLEIAVSAIFSYYSFLASHSGSGQLAHGVFRGR
jgi:hypothetical protein